MTLLVNTFVTNNTRTRYNRLRYSFADRFDIMKYALASWSVLPIKRAVLYIQLDEPFQHRQQELEKYISEIFNHVPYEYHSIRNGTQSQWQEVVNRLPDDPIWLSCNDDHIYLEPNNEIVESILPRLQKERASFYYSHWPEILRVSTNPNKCKHTSYEKEFGAFYWNSPCSIQIYNADLLKEWWNLKDYGSTFFPRTDWWPSIEPEEYKCYFSLKNEVCRHFDGYSHIEYFDQTWCPPLRIPEGFFEANIKIAYGFDTNRGEGFTNLNPNSEKSSSATNPQGPDYHWLKSDIPLFWSSRISETIIGQRSLDEIPSRNTAHLLKATAEHRSEWTKGASEINTELLRVGFKKLI